MLVPDASLVPDAAEEDGGLGPSTSTAVYDPPHIPRGQATFDFDVGCDVVGDIRLTLYDHDAKPPQDEVACFLCFHTGFVAQAETVFAKDAIDI